MQSGALSRAILLDPSLKESVTSVLFSATEEILWSGTATGGLFSLQCPDLEIYSTVRAHKVPILGTVPLGDGIVSISQDRVRWHSSGGFPRATLTIAQAEVEAFTAVCAEHHSRGQVMMAYSSSAAASPAQHGVALVDLFTGKVLSKAAVPEPMYTMKCAARGLVALGSPGGTVALADPRAGFKAQHSVAAHTSGLADMDARADALATCGYGTRQGQVVAENYVKVYDLRAAPHMTGSVAFPAGPSLLRFHPKFSTTLLIASSSGTFTLADSSGTTFARYERLETEGDTITACDVASSGEHIAFGSAAGYVYLWSMGQEPRVNQHSLPLEIPERRPPPPAVPLAEDDSFALAAVYPAGQGRLLSDMSAAELTRSHKPPRLVHPLVQAGLKQVDFVGYAQNPHFKRGLPKGEAARAAGPLRNLRVEHKPEKLDLTDGRAERERKRAAAGQSYLPDHYRHVTLRQVHTSRFDDFDFALHNPTRFAGLENEIANCYSNSLLQVLYFIPELRAALLAVRPDPDEEFSLLDETTLLFRMLLAGGPAACQATNLLRALRQNRGAAALGLLETHSQRSGENTDIEVETNKEKSLQRRVQSLQRFLLERLKSELAQRKQPQPADSAPSTSVPPNTDVSKSGDTDARSCSDSGEADERPASHHVPCAAETANVPSAVAPEPPPGDDKLEKKYEASMKGGPEAWPSPGDVAAEVDSLFGILMQQRIRCLYGEKAEKLQDILSFQVELQYPAAKERPTRAGGEAQPLSFRPGEAPKATALPQWAPDQARPSFSGLLAASLKPSGDMRAWFDDRLKYQHVQQLRLPKKLPTVLVVSCGLLDCADLVWWQPYHDSPAGRRSSAWLPAAIEVTSDCGTSEVRVREADNAADLATPEDSSPGDAAEPRSGRTRAVYELTALVAHILEDKVPKEKGKGKKDPHEDEGHIIAHIKVLPPYVQAGGRGFLPDVAKVSSPGASPLPPAFTRPRSAPTSRLQPPPPDAVEAGDAGADLPEASASSGAAETATQLESAAANACGPGESPSSAADAPSVTEQHIVARQPEGEAPPHTEALSLTSAAVAPKAETGPGSKPGGSTPSADFPGGIQTNSGRAEASGAAEAGEIGATAEQGGSTEALELELDRGSEPAALAAARSASLPGPARSLPEALPKPAQLGAPDAPIGQSAEAEPPKQSPKRRPDWLLFNDFCVTPTNAVEVTQLYGLQKVPCLLYYKRVESIEAAAQLPQPKQAPVLSLDAFRRLCSAPPLQASVQRLKAPTFKPLGPDEEIVPDTLLGIDTEFVAHSPPDKVMRGGVEVETRPSRLGLARVSVVRGSGPLRGEPCIDDYIRATEPVFDYLTKWSGLVPGDLDPALSRHHLTTHKAAYLKLCHLIDAGAIFVGHGLKKDFRMLNIVVPPAQVVDTVELFHFKRQRKLSLRFLAGYLLGAAIQQDTHDSIVDARTALSLFQVYEELNAEGRFQEKLLEMYRWGKANGWDGSAPPQQPAAGIM